MIALQVAVHKSMFAQAAYAIEAGDPLKRMDLGKCVLSEVLEEVGEDPEEEFAHDGLSDFYADGTSLSILDADRVEDPLELTRHRGPFDRTTMDFLIKQNARFGEDDLGFYAEY